MKYFFITFYLFLCIAEISSQPYTTLIPQHYYKIFFLST